MSNSKVQVKSRLTASTPPQPVKQVPAGTFSNEETRVRAYQIYEASDRTTQHPDADWFQAETELMEMVGGK